MHILDLLHLTVLSTYIHGANTLISANIDEHLFVEFIFEPPVNMKVCINTYYYS